MTARAIRVAAAPRSQEALGRDPPARRATSGRGARARRPRSAPPTALTAWLQRARRGGAHRGVPRLLRPSRTPYAAAVRGIAGRRTAAALASPGASGGPGTRSPLGSAVAGTLEGDLRVTPLSDALARRAERQRDRARALRGTRRGGVSACAGTSTRTRSGADVPSRASCAHLAPLLQMPAVSALAAGGRTARCGGSPAAARSTAPRSPGWPSRSRCCSSASCAARTCPGASDNASGTAVALQLAAECAAAPLAHTEVDVLITSCEESGLLGAQAYARRHAPARRGDHVPELRHRRRATSPLTYILREGSATVTRPASRAA